MAGERFTKVTHLSWFDRFRQSIAAVFLGIIIFMAAFPLLFWNEGRAVKTAKPLDEGFRVVVTASADRVDSANDQRLVHVTGRATTDQFIQDTIFGISVNAIKLDRVVAVYQWQEKRGGGEMMETSYTYNKVWSRPLIDSGQFAQPEGHLNPSTKPLEDSLQVAQRVSLGAFVLSKSLIDKMKDFQQLPATEELWIDVSDQLLKKLKLAGGSYYLGADPLNPQVGDVRIGFQVVRPTTVSIVAKQAGSTFEPYRTKAGGSIEMLKTGSFSASEMFQEAMASNKSLIWALRFVGLIMLFLGVVLVLSPLEAVASVVPLLGDLVRLGIWLFAGVISLALSVITISIGWLFYRPLIGIPLIAVAVGAVAALKQLGRKRRIASALPQRAREPQESAHQ